MLVSIDGVNGRGEWTLIRVGSTRGIRVIRHVLEIRNRFGRDEARHGESPMWWWWSMSKTCPCGGHSLLSEYSEWLRKGV